MAEINENVLEGKTDEEIFSSLLDEETEKVCTRDFAVLEFARVLKNWKVLKKALRKAESKNKEEKEGYQSAKELIITAIMDGVLMIEKDTRTGLHVRHILTVSIENAKGETIIDELIYRKVPKIVDLRKMDEFEDQESIAKTQALAAALSGRDTKELANLSSADLDMMGALFYFFV